MQLLITHVNINCVKVNNNEIIMRNNVLSHKRLKFKTEMPFSQFIMYRCAYVTFS